MFRKLHQQAASIFLVVWLYVGISLVTFSFELLISDMPIFSKENLLSSYRLYLHPYFAGLALLCGVWLGLFCVCRFYYKQRNEKDIDRSRVYVTGVRDLELNFELLDVKFPINKRKSLLHKRLAIPYTTVFRIVQVYIGLCLCIFTYYFFSSRLVIASKDNLRHAFNEGLLPFYPGLKQLLLVWLTFIVYGYLKRKKSPKAASIL